MSDQGPIRDASASIPVNRRFHGLGLAALVLVSAAVLSGAWWAYRKVAANAGVAACKENLSKLGAALQAYHERHGSFPPAFVKGKDGKPAHSWRVLILPELGRQDLLDAYRMEEPWDSPNNRRLVEQMPDVFACPGDAGRAKGTTSYVAVVGSQTAWPGERAVSLPKITDGTAMTAQLIELADSDIAWTEPRDVAMDDIFPPDREGVGARFASRHEGNVNLLFCDGRVWPFDAVATNRDPRKLLYAFVTAYGSRPYRGEWLPGESAATAVGNFPAEQNADTLRTTDVTPHAADAIQADRNYVYCATFQMAWDDFRQLVGGDPQIEGQPAIAAGLNGTSFPRWSLSPKSYVARMCLGDRDAILAEMAEKFPGVTPSLDRAAGPLEVTAYAFLQKNLPFAVRFDPIAAPLVFHAAAGDVKVAGFGFKELAGAAGQLEGLRKQVEVLHYASDDEFILRLTPTADEIVLAKIRPAATLSETLLTVQKLIGAGMKDASGRRLEDKDKLLMPRLGFNVLRRYQELIGKRVENPGKQDWQIVEAKQAVRFLLNESGARLESEVELSVATDGKSETPPPRPRMFVFDRPFLLYLKEAGAKQPYLVMWIANAELMERRD